MPLERRNTISTVPSHITLLSKPHDHHSASFGTTAMSSSTNTNTTISSSSYTSIKEVIVAAAANSPVGGSGEISIRNHLVKQAAWAYLRPMSTSPESSSGHLLRRVAAAVFEFPLFSLLRSAARAVVNAFNCFGF